MDKEKITKDNAGQVPTKDPSSLDQTENIKQVNQALGYEYDTTVIGNITSDNEYADPNNKEFVWPENYIRVKVPFDKNLVGTIRKTSIIDIDKDSCALGKLV